MVKLFEQLKEIAANNNAELLSTKWIGQNVKYVFKINDGRIIAIQYQWIKKFGFPKNEITIKNSVIKVNNLLNLSETISSINKKTPYRKKPHEYLENLQNFVKEKYNGKLLSTEWKGYKKSLYKFQDESGTEFEQTAENILHKKLWTPGRGLMAEPITRQIFEHLFQAKFPKNISLLTKNSVSINSNYLELDGYNEALKIAFEYQGFPSHWDKSHNKYIETKKRDLLKKKLCKHLGVLLIQVSKYNQYNLRHFKDTEVLNHVLNDIKKTYIKHNIELPNLNINNFKIDFKCLNHGAEKIKEMEKIAKLNNANLISTEYKGSLFKYKFHDLGKGEEFEISWKQLKKSGYPKRFSKKEIM